MYLNNCNKVNYCVCTEIIIGHAPNYLLDMLRINGQISRCNVFCFGAKFKPDGILVFYTKLFENKERQGILDSLDLFTSNGIASWDLHINSEHVQLFRCMSNN